MVLDAQIDLHANDFEGQMLSSICWLAQSPGENKDLKNAAMTHASTLVGSHQQLDDDADVVNMVMSSLVGVINVLQVVSMMDCWNLQATFGANLPCYDLNY